MQPEQEVINRWSGSAPFWEKHHEIIRQMFAPITQALVEDGQIGSQQVVLDIATGPGEPALSVDAFRFASLGKLRKVLNEAGAIALSERLLQFTIQAPISVEEFWTLRLEMSDKLREKIAALSKDQMADVNRQALDSLREYSTDRE